MKARLNDYVWKNLIVFTCRHDGSKNSHHDKLAPKLSQLKFHPSPKWCNNTTQTKSLKQNLQENKHKTNKKMSNNENKHISNNTNTHTQNGSLAWNIKAIDDDGT